MSGGGIEHGGVEGVNDSGIELMNDMLLEMLSKSSVDSLLSHKSVSKLWHDLICGPDFIKLHLQHSNRNMKYILCRNPEDCSVCLMDTGGEITTNFPLPEFLQSLFVRVVNCFNGLLFMTCEKPPNELLVLTCNPATRKVSLIPNGTPSAVFPTVGIAFNLENFQYKIFRFYKDLHELDEDCYACEVYASVSGLWRSIENVKYRPVVTPFSSCNDHVCVYGTIYWLGCPKEDHKAAPTCIMSIDMNDEKLKTIDFPGCQEVTHFSFLINLEGRLSLVTVDCPNLCSMGRCGPGMPDSPAQAHLWHAEDLDQSKWLLKTAFKIHVDEIYTFHSVVALENDIFFIIADVKDVLHYHIYHVADSSWTVLDLPENGYDPSFWDWPVAFPFAESLCPCS